MTPPRSAAIAAALLFLCAVSLPPPSAHALGGSIATIAVVYGSATTICSITAQPPVQQIQCWSNGLLLPPILPNTSFDAVAGGRDTLCGLRSGGFSLLCWNTTFTPKRIYNNASAPLTAVTVGGAQICALRNVSSADNAICWRQNSSHFPNRNSNSQFRSISSGSRFSCGVTRIENRVLCWGDDAISDSIQSELENYSMLNIQVGEKFACGINVTGFIVCKGSNDSGQLNIPPETACDSGGLAVGANHSCAIRKSNGTVVCWGGIRAGNENAQISSEIRAEISFESIVAGPDFTCGLTTNNFSIYCWGSGFPYAAGIVLPLQKTLPGPCVDSACDCNVYPGSEFLCSGNGHICRDCDFAAPVPPLLQQPVVFTRSPPSSGLRKGLLAFAIVGSVGGVAGVATVMYCLWTGVCFGKKKVHNSVQPTITGGGGAPPSSSNSGPLSRSSTLRRQGSRLMRRQRSGTSSKHADKAEEFFFSDLVAATDDFSVENRIGGGSFGAVYRGKLLDGREVAIKRSESGGEKSKKFQEKESAFESELAFLSRLHHKHLVRLVGFCHEREERLLVYEFMKNGALYDHLHSSNNVEKSSSFLNSWKVRIKISLDAARGIEYLHNYAVPPIIHRDIKSSNILLDSNWMARVSDFGLSLMWAEDDRDCHRSTKAAGTVGYIDPEYYGLNVLTAKSDVYGLGVVLLELLTGKRAIFNGGEPTSVVDYAVPKIVAGDVAGILDSRVGEAEGSEAEAVELVAYTAVHCVHLEGKDRPSMSDIVANLERALALCDDNSNNVNSHGSISSGPISNLSD